jgi:hypothetical protein
MSCRFQFTLQFREVVNLTIKDYPNGFFLVGHRLMSATKIYDRQTPKSEPERAIEIETFVIWATVNN